MDETYVEQPRGFKNKDFSSICYKLYKALYGLNKLLKLDDRLSKFLGHNDFSMGKVYTTLLLKEKKMIYSLYKYMCGSYFQC